MRRPISTLLLVAFTALAGLRLAAAAQDTEAVRCAIACGHAVGTGASCCPMPGSGPSFETCPGGDGVLVPVAAQPALLARAAGLTAPWAARFLETIPNPAPRSATPRALDHVPLLLG